MKTTKCKHCGNRTSRVSDAMCQRCKSLRHHGFKRVKKEELLLDTVGGVWCVWDKIGNVLAGPVDSRNQVLIDLHTGVTAEDYQEEKAS